MSEFILHHYPYSPFSEKLRAMLGYADLNWQSVITKELPPRPMVEQLVGGYRKIPVSQIGADIFCDSHVIAEEISRLSNLPELDLNNCPSESQAIIPFTETDAFFAFVLTAGSLSLYKKAMSNMSMWDMFRFIWDRIQIGRTASVKIVGIREARQVAQAQLQKLEMLLKHDFLFGDKPNHVDFAAYHGPWIAFTLSEKNVPSAYPKVAAWMERIKSFGQGTPTEISGKEALDIARNAQPRPIDDADKTDPLIGKHVQIAPSDYAQTPTLGILVGSTPTRWIISRTDEELGSLHIHFPKQGFELATV